MTPFMLCKQVADLFQEYSQAGGVRPFGIGMIVGGFDEESVLCEDCDYVKRASKTWRFRFLNMTFGFDPRRLDQDGVVETGMTYLKANVRRFFEGEMRNNEMNYQFGHYREQ